MYLGGPKPSAKKGDKDYDDEAHKLWESLGFDPKDSQQGRCNYSMLDGLWVNICLLFLSSYKACVPAACLLLWSEKSTITIYKCFFCDVCRNIPKQAAPSTLAMNAPPSLMMC